MLVKYFVKFLDPYVKVELRSPAFQEAYKTNYVNDNGLIEY